MALETTQEIGTHIRLAHNITKFYLCNICFVYFTMDNLKPHKKAAHDGLMLSLGKGQLILKCPFGTFKPPKKPTNFFPGFLP